VPAAAGELKLNHCASANGQEVASGGNTVVKHLMNHLKVEALSSATASGTSGTSYTSGTRRD